jgi:hypothetical protein
MMDTINNIDNESLSVGIVDSDDGPLVNALRLHIKEYYDQTSKNRPRSKDGEVHSGTVEESN